MSGHKIVPASSLLGVPEPSKMRLVNKTTETWQSNITQSAKRSNSTQGYELLPEVSFSNPSWTAHIVAFALVSAGAQQQGYLHVLVWVPVTVIDDDSVGSSQIDAQPTGSGGQQEHKDLRVSVEGTNGFLPVLPAHTAVDTA